MAGWGGPLGALLGLVAGLVQLRVGGRAVVAALRRTDRSETDEERADYARRIRILQAVMAAMALGVLPALGFVLGRALTG